MQSPDELKQIKELEHIGKVMSKHNEEVDKYKNRKKDCKMVVDYINKNILDKENELTSKAVIKRYEDHMAKLS